MNADAHGVCFPVVACVLCVAERSPEPLLLSPGRGPQPFSLHPISDAPQEANVCCGAVLECSLQGAPHLI